MSPFVSSGKLFANAAKNVNEMTILDIFPEGSKFKHLIVK